MKQIILLLFYVFLSHASAQTNVSSDESFDELLQSYSKFIYKDASKALTYALKAKGIAVVNANNEQLAQVFYYISKCHYRLDENNIALKNIESAISKTILLKDTKLLYECFSLKGDILSELGEDSKALIAYLKAKEYAKDFGDILHEVHLLSSIAYIKKIHKDFEEAIQNYKNILQLLNTLEADKNADYYRLIALMNIADIYLWKENPDEAALYNNAGLKKCEKTKKWAYYPLLLNKAIIHYQREQYNQCTVLAKKIRDYALKDQEEKLYITSLFYLGKGTYQLKKYQESIHYLEKALEITSSSDNVNINEKEFHEFLALGYNKIGNSEKTSFHFEKYSLLEKKQSLEDLKINNETHELLDVVPLKTEINQLGKKLTKQTKSEKKLVILFVCLLGLFIGIAMYYKVKGKLIRKKFEELLKKVSQLEQHKPVAVVHKKNKAPDQKERMLLDKIADFEKEEYYLSTACNLGFMAQKLETNTSYLSKVINTHKGKSFSNYITELRINTALVRLKNDKKLHSYTIQGIAEEFGFKRQETFARAFKTHTGINPSQYLKNLSKTS
ncbi:helix-turn-helix domain-containing protein [uncultured Kordia sp.]|uniref:helix-turn-helix domain-containing protein n=1 Tax=uncultured Kordia sp. TaxID=507699 RepID=UPI00260EE184|nr:helix-turn-helix domain-containing protein [uncultured Kordia sp.]